MLPAAAASSLSIKEEDAQRFRKIDDFPVQKMVHSLAVDTSSHRVYAPEQEENGHPVARMVVYEAVVEKEKK